MALHSFSRVKDAPVRSTSPGLRRQTVLRDQGDPPIPLPGSLHSGVSGYHQKSERAVWDAANHVRLHRENCLTRRAAGPFRMISPPARSAHPPGLSMGSCRIPPVPGVRIVNSHRRPGKRERRAKDTRLRSATQCAVSYVGVLPRGLDKEDRSRPCRPRSAGRVSPAPKVDEITPDTGARQHSERSRDDAEAGARSSSPSRSDLRPRTKKRRP
jgi:hypothetical protein